MLEGVVVVVRGVGRCGDGKRRGSGGRKCCGELKINDGSG